MDSGLSFAEHMEKNTIINVITWEHRSSGGGGAAGTQFFSACGSELLNQMECR